MKIRRHNFKQTLDIFLLFLLPSLHFLVAGITFYIRKLKSLHTFTYNIISHFTFIAEGRWQVNSTFPHSILFAADAVRFWYMYYIILYIVHGPPQCNEAITNINDILIFIRS